MKMKKWKERVKEEDDSDGEGCSEGDFGGYRQGLISVPISARYNDEILEDDCELTFFKKSVGTEWPSSEVVTNGGLRVA